MIFNLAVTFNYRFIIEIRLTNFDMSIHLGTTYVIVLDLLVQSDVITLQVFYLQYNCIQYSSECLTFE